MAKRKKLIDKDKTRFFFTSPPDLTAWIYDNCESQGLYPYEFIRAFLIKNGLQK